MLSPSSNTKIYICTGHTDMRKGAGTLSLIAQSVVLNEFTSGAMFVFRGKRADKIKKNTLLILWMIGLDCNCKK